MNQKTAILLFSRTAGAEASHKLLHRRRDRNLQFVEAMIRRTRKLIGKSGLPTFWVDEHQQEGQTFGERLFHAASSVFSRGYEQLIILGNDAPQLRTSDILRAESALRAGKAVLGLDQRGGAYLIGLHRAHCQESLQELPWQTDGIGASLKGWLKDFADETSALLLRESDLLDNPQSGSSISYNSVVYLRSLRDLNNGAECRMLRTFLLSIRAFAACLQSATTVARPLAVSAFSRPLVRSHSLRGPPSMAA